MIQSIDNVIQILSQVPILPLSIILLFPRNTRALGLVLLGCGILFGWNDFAVYVYGMFILIYGLFFISIDCYKSTTNNKSKGDKGPKGDPGPKGDQGPRGDSPYEVAKANGYTGSEMEFNAALTAIPDIVYKMKSK